MRKDIHLASSMQALNELAKKPINHIKPQKLMLSAEKIFQSGLQKLHEGDEEIAYIYFVRFKTMYDFLQKAMDDLYTKQRLGSEYKTVNEQIITLTFSLHNRYKSQKNIKEIVKKPPSPVELKLTSTPVIHFPSGFISCNELHMLILKDIDIIILDCRPRESYFQSRMKTSHSANIPEEIIKTGSSANILGKKVPNESVEHWNRRWLAEMTVLLDWSSNKETLTASKLSVLRNILLEWDTTKVDDYPLLILNGGYLEWLQMYPMYCINPNIVHEVQNTVLNDLLDIDSIEYPSTEEATSTPFSRTPSILPIIDRATKPIINEKNKDTKQPDTKGDLNELNAKRQLNEEEEERKRIEIQQREEKLLNEKAALEKSKDELNRENEALRKELQNLTIPSKPIQNKDIDDIRERLLHEAREKKKTVKISQVSLHEITKQRLAEFEIKVKHLGKVIIPPGLAGLVNLGYTCYMNSVIQCLSNTRLLHNFFILGECPNGELYNGSYGPVADELKIVIQRLWSGRVKYIAPNKFKQAVDCHGPRFKGKEQHDAHEFMLCLTSWLHDDLKMDVKRPLQVVWTPRQKSWNASTDGKTSVIMETFYGQQLNIITCDECKKMKDKFEIFENLTLALPRNGTCTLDECLKQFFSKQLIEDYDCKVCKTNKLVKMEVKLVAHPPVLVLNLKRFTNSSLSNGQYTFIKNVIPVNYPLKHLKVFGISYNLYGVIVHRAATLTLTSGHYVAICKNLRNGRWYQFDDQCVTEVSSSDAFEPSNAYVLFYQQESEENTARQQFNY